MTPRPGVGSEIIHTASLKILLEHIDGWTGWKSRCIAALIGDDTWAGVQQRVTAHKHMHRQATGEYLLTGLP
jgi:hypothetical protein